jgi:hypothetical protein
MRLPDTRASELTRLALLLLHPLSLGRYVARTPREQPRTVRGTPPASACAPSIYETWLVRLSVILVSSKRVTHNSTIVPSGGPFHGPIQRSERYPTSSRHDLQMARRSAKARVKANGPELVSSGPCEVYGSPRLTNQSVARTDKSKKPRLLRLTEGPGASVFAATGESGDILVTRCHTESQAPLSPSAV